ncbi:MAG: glycosyl transferase [Acidimicrobiia bacterium]|nr:MAG: glycosyl transferase [Acidimicrobiia bacterium]
MRIGIVAPVWFPVPPSGYGGIELVVSLLADGLVDAGHDVTLFASGGSSTKATLVTPMQEPPEPAELGNPWYDAFHALTAYQHVEGFDVVHDHAGVMGPVCGAMLGGSPPVVHTLHGPWTAPSRLLYRALSSRVHLVAISNAQAAENTEVHYAATVYNGIDLDAYPYREDKEDYLVYIGRANPDKGPAEAIRIARRVGLPLKMILKRGEPAERYYFEHEVEPLVAHDVELFENVPHATKVELLGRARAMVFPIRWPEPFGLVMVEAMACGTPVVTTNWGAAPELVDHGVTGFRAEGSDELADLLGKVDQIDPAACRARVEEHFSAEAMVRGYEAVYARVVGG